MASTFKRDERTYLPEFVYGATDGAVTTFAVVTGCIGASLNSSIVLILGLANLVGDGFSMATADYLSTKSRTDLHKKNPANALKSAFATFLSFVIIGFIPLLSFVLAALFPTLAEFQFLLSFYLTAGALLLVGAVKGTVVKKHPLRSSLETLLIGGIAALLAYGVGAGVKALIS